MNGNASYAQMRAGSMSGPDFSHFKQEAGSAPSPHIAGHQRGTMGSTQFVFKTSDLSGGRPLSYSSQTMGGLYGGGMQAGMGGE